MAFRMFAAKGLLLAALLASAATGLTVDPIGARRALMKENGRDIKAAFALIKGEVPFDAAAAQAILARVDTAAQAFGGYFPAGSDAAAGKGDTAAAPAVWSKPDEFAAALAKFKADAAAAKAAQPASVEAFKAAFGPVAGNCRSCHDSFRIERP